MAFSHGSKARIWLDDQPQGTLTDVSCYANNVGWPRNQETADTATFCTTARSYVPGMNSSTITMSGRYDPVIDTILQAHFGSSDTLTVQFDPQGTDTGLPRQTAEAILTSYNLTADIGDMLGWTADFQVSGPVATTVQ